MKIARFAAVAAPLFIVAYGVIRLIGRMDGTYGPGLDWQAAHLANLVGLVLFVFLVLGIRRLLAPGWGRFLALIPLRRLLERQVVEELGTSAPSPDQASISAA